MEVSFDDLKYLVTVVTEDFLKDDFGNFQDSSNNDLTLSDISEEMYDKVHVLVGLLEELYKHRPLPF